MDANDLLLWLAGLSAAMLVVVALRSRPRAQGWLIAGLLLLAVSVVGWLVFPAYAGIAAGVAWGALVLLPSLAQRLVVRFTLAQRFTAAERAATVAALFHPFDGWREQPRILRALALAKDGRFEEAWSALRALGAADSPLNRAATALAYRLSGRYEELAAWCESRLPPEAIAADWSIASSYLRALGETGRISELLRFYERTLPRVAGSAMTVYRAQARLLALAFTGRGAAVTTLLAGPLRHYAPDLRELWAATALAAAGETAAARERLLALRAKADPATRIVLERRLGPAAQAPVVLSPADLARVARIEQELAEEERYGRDRVVAARPVATLVLLVANLAVFAVELSRGAAENADLLFELGALDPRAALAGEWWRLFTAIFLHFGWLHLLMNMGGLLLIGSFVERSAGAARYLLVYLVAGVGSMLCVALLARSTGTLVVGASGAILGLLGADAALLLDGWRRGRAATARRRLLELVAILVLQVVFDLSTPQVSFVGHATGAALGFVAMWTLRPRPFTSRTK